KYKDKDTKLVKRNYYIDEKNARALTVLSALTGKELSILVNEAISHLIKKYQPKTEIDLMDIRGIGKES
ncbi:MAG TPA: ribbon-helix-helix domain-containing protein, partial [Deltaproteobacteria bacterium]|nr:ribbon-helix-helix domain-containing protein [Deltaproteobacteria bacterium]